MKAHISKVFCLNEDVKFPTCPDCKKELSPHSITQEDLEKLPEELVMCLSFCGHLIMGVVKGNHLIFVCTDCLEHILEVTND